VVASAQAARDFRLGGNCLCRHAAGRAHRAGGVLRFPYAVDRWPCLADERAAAHWRSLGRPRARGLHSGLLDRDVCRARLAAVAAPSRLLRRLDHPVDRARRPAEDLDECRLPVGPRTVRWPLPLHRVVRRPSGRAASRPLLPRSPRQLRLCAPGPILRFSRAARADGQVGAMARRAHGTGVWTGAAGTRRAFPFARPVERVPGLDGHAVRLCVRVPRPVVGVRQLRCDSDRK
jgi:hypothetical protein